MAKKRKVIMVVAIIIASCLACVFIFYGADAKNVEQNKTQNIIYKPVNEEIIVQKEIDKVPAKQEINKELNEDTKEEELEPETEVYLYSYVRKLTRVKGTKTDVKIQEINHVYKEDVTGEPIMCFTCYSDIDNSTYQYFFLNTNDAVDWIKTNGDKNITYTMMDPDDIYENTMKASFENGEWIVEMVGKWGSITLDEFARGKEFFEIMPNNSLSNDNNSCSLDEFTAKYSGDFDSDEDAEDWWFDYGCEPRD